MPRTYGPESFEALMSLIVDRVMAEPIDQRDLKPTIRRCTLAKEKYVRPEHQQPAIQELLAKMNETDVRMFKFINDSGLYSDESILGLLDLEKRVIKQNKKNKNGNMKLMKITEEQRALLETEDIVFARWISGWSNYECKLFYKWVQI